MQIDRAQMELPQITMNTWQEIVDILKVAAHAEA